MSLRPFTTPSRLSNPAKIYGYLTLTGYAHYALSGFIKMVQKDQMDFVAERVALLV